MDTTHLPLRLVPAEQTDEHYNIQAEIDNLIYPDYPTSIFDLKRNDETREAQYLYKKMLLWHTEQNQYVGYGSYGHTYWAHHPDRYYIDFSIRPDQWGQGYGKYLYDTLYAELATYRPMSVEAETRENLERGIRFLTDRGYTLATTEYSSCLELADFDPVPFAGLIEKLKAEGFRFCNTLVYEQQEPDFMRKLYTAACAIEDDIPWHETTTHEPFELFEKKYHMRPQKRIDECSILALFDGEIAGLTNLTRSLTDPTKLYTGVSGVMRPYRRRGVVSALKAISLGWAKDNLVTDKGIVPAVYTENEENNPMYTINQRMGFVKQPSFLSYIKKLSE